MKEICKQIKDKLFEVKNPDSITEKFKADVEAIKAKNGGKGPNDFNTVAMAFIPSTNEIVITAKVVKLKKNLKGPDSEDPQFHTTTEQMKIISDIVKEVFHL